MVNKGVAHGCLPGNSAATEGIGSGTAGPRRRRAGTRILYLAPAQPQKGSPGRESNGHLRKNDRLPAAAERVSGRDGRGATARRMEEETGRPTETALPRSPGSGHPEVPARKAEAGSRHF